MGPLKTARLPVRRPSRASSTSFFTSAGRNSAGFTKSTMPSFTPHFVSSVFHDFERTSFRAFS
jgi:hypothetical protein